MGISPAIVNVRDYRREIVNVWDDRREVVARPDDCAQETINARSSCAARAR
jgi:hypothetical protein